LEIIDAINRGDDDAFAVLYHRHREWVHRLAWRFTQNQEDTLDVLQETFAYLARKFPGLTLTASMTTFLYPVVKHLALAAKQKSRRQSTADDAMLNAVPDKSAADPADCRPELSAVLTALPEGHREVLLMRFVDGLSLAEIAEALAIPVGTVKSRLHNALSQLKADPRAKAYFGV